MRLKDEVILQGTGVRGMWAQRNTEIQYGSWISLSIVLVKDRTAPSNRRKETRRMLTHGKNGQELQAEDVEARQSRVGGS